MMEVACIIQSGSLTSMDQASDLAGPVPGAKRGAVIAVGGSPRRAPPPPPPPPPSPLPGGSGNTRFITKPALLLPAGGPADASLPRSSPYHYQLKCCKFPGLPGWMSERQQTHIYGMQEPAAVSSCSQPGYSNTHLEVLEGWLNGGIRGDVIC